jgi:hypothetical protein
MRTILSDVDRVLASIPYKAWAKLHTIDAAKVASERKGTRRPLSGDPYGRVLIEAIRVGIEWETPPPLPAPFNGRGLALLEPRGGTEDIAAAKAAGFTYLLLNIAFVSGGSWDVQRQRADSLGLAVVPWRRVLGPQDSAQVEAVAHAWGSPAVAHNLEAEAVTTYTPAQLAATVTTLGYKRQRAVITEPWAQNGAGWGALKDWVAMPEAFMNANPIFTPSAVTTHAHQEGMPMSVPLFGWGVWGDAPHDVSPASYLGVWRGPFAVYPGDGKEAQYGEWRL